MPTLREIRITSPLGERSPIAGGHSRPGSSAGAIEAVEAIPLLSAAQHSDGPTLQDLPRAVQERIFGLLAAEDCGRLAATSTAMRQAVQSPNLWRRQIQALDSPPAACILRRFPSRWMRLQRALASAETYLMAGAAGAPLGAILGLCTAGSLATLLESIASLPAPPAGGRTEDVLRRWVAVGAVVGAAAGGIVGIGVGCWVASEEQEAKNRRRFSAICNEGRQAYRLLQTAIATAVDERAATQWQSSLHTWAQALAQLGRKSILGHALRTGDDATMQQVMAEMLSEQQYRLDIPRPLGLGAYAPAKFAVQALRRATRRKQLCHTLSLLKFGIPMEAVDEDGVTAREVVLQILANLQRQAIDRQDVAHILQLVAALGGDVGEGARLAAVRLVYFQERAGSTKKRFPWATSSDAAGRTEVAGAYPLIMQPFDRQQQVDVLSQAIARALSERDHQTLLAWLSFADRRGDVASAIKRGELRDCLAENLLQQQMPDVCVDSLVGWGVLPRFAAAARCAAAITTLSRHLQAFVEAGDEQMARRMRELCLLIATSSGPCSDSSAPPCRPSTSI